MCSVPLPVSGTGCQLPAPKPSARLRAIRHAAHARRFEEVIKKVAAAHLHLRELGDAGRLRILIRPQKGEDRDIGHTGVIRVRIIRRTAVAGLPYHDTCQDWKVAGVVKLSTVL